MTVIAKGKKKKRKPFPFKKKLLASTSEPLTLKDTVTKWSGFYSQVSQLNLTGASSIQELDLEIHESDFFRRLRDAQEENFSASFQSFVKDVFLFKSSSVGKGKKSKRTTDFTDCTQSLAIFLYNREHIYQTLIQGLEKNELSDLGSLYNVSVGFFVDASLTKEVERYFDGFMKVFQSSLIQRTDASTVQVIFQSLLSIVKELLKNSSLTPMQISDKLIYLFDSKKYPDYVIDFSSVVLAPVIRKNKFHPDEVLKSIIATKCPDGIVKALGRSIKNFGSNFFSGAEQAWTNFLESIEDPHLLEELHDFIINSEPSVKEFEPLVKLTVKAFLSNPIKFSSSFNKLLKRKKGKYVPGEYILIILKNGPSGQLFDDGGGGMLIVNSLMSLPESKVPEVELKNFIRSVLKGRPHILSEFSAEDDKFDYIVLPLYIETCSLLGLDEDIVPYMESLAKVIMESSTGSSHLPNYKIIEFSTDQPNSLKTFPNRIIPLLEDANAKESALKALVGIRPLNKAHIISKLKIIKKSEFQDNEASYLIVYLCHSLLSKPDFLQMMKDLAIVDKLLNIIGCPKPSVFSFQMLDIICSAGLTNRASDISSALIPHLSNGDSKIRLCVLNSLIFTNSCEEEKTLMRNAFQAENMVVDISNYKERIRLLNYLERLPDGEEESLRSSSSIEEIRIRVMLSNLMINFSLLWEPIIQLVLSFPRNSSDEAFFWKIYFEVLGESYDQINQGNGCEGVDYVNYRNLLLKICESVPGTQLQKWNRHFVSNFLDKFLSNEFHRKLVDADKLEEVNEEELEEDISDSKVVNDDETESMEVDKNDVDEEVEETRAPQYFKAVKNVSKSLSHHLKIFSRMSNLRSVYRFSELRDFIVHNLLSDSFLENRKMALDFITVSENKNIRPNQKEMLTALTDKKRWKSNLREFVQKYNEEIESYSPVSWISNRFIAGMFKETRHMKRTIQMSTRKTIMEIISKLKNFGDILNEILDDIEETNFWELSFDMLLIARQYLSTSDNLAHRAIETVKNNLPYHRKSGESKKSKERYKAIEVYTRLIETLRNQYLWPIEKKKQFMEICVLPLFIDIYERRVLSKNALILFKALILNSLEWVIIRTSTDASLLDHILKDFLENRSFDGSEFYKLNLNVLCRILQRLVIGEDEGLSEPEKVLISDESCLLKAKLALPIISSINLKANIDDINLRLIALRGLLSLFPKFELSKQELHKLCDHVASKIRFSSPELQSDCLQIILIALKKLDKANKDQLPYSVFKLIPKIIDPNQKCKYVETVFSLVTDNSEYRGHEIAYDICQNFENFLDNPSPSLKVFLFYNALGEVKRSEFANRRIGSNCMMGLLKANEVDLITTHVLPEIVAALGNTKSSGETTTEMITLLQFLIKEYSDSVDDLKILSKLTNVLDMDEDFYANMKHLQSIRRSRAIKRMAKKFVDLEEEFSRNDGYMRVVFDYIYPLCSAVLFNEKSTKYSELIESSIDLIGSLAQRCDFNRYKKILMYYLSMDRPQEESHSAAFAKQRIKLIARILDAFHFESQTVDFLLSKVFTIIDSGGNQGYENSSHEVLYLPIVKLLQINNSPSKDEYTSRIIVKLAKGLRMREFSTRERVRSTLNSIARLLGHNYFAYIIEILESSLKRGYELHVLIYSVKSMIIACSKDLPPGSLDSILPPLMKFTRLELFESVKEEKSISKIRTQTPEAKKTSSFSSLEVLAKLVSRSISMNVIKPIGNLLHEFKSFEALENIRRLFKHISDGLSANESLKTLDLLAMAHSVLNGKIFGSSETLIALSSRQTTILVEFALLLLTRVLNGTSNLNAADFASFIPIIIDKSQKIRDTEVISLTVSIFNRLVHMSDSFRDLVPMNDVFTLIVRALIVESLYSKEQDKVRFQDLASSFLNGFLEKGGKFNSEDKESIKLFLQYIIDSKSIGSRTAKLLGAVIKQDSMSELNKAILERLCKDYVETVDVNLMRTISSSIINYYKSSKSADWILLFLLQQFNYSGEKGRLRAMKMMSDIMGNAKIKTKNTSYASIFVMVAKTLAEEKSPPCIEALRSILNSLRCSENDVKTISQLLDSWISGVETNNLIIGAKTIFQISKTENSKLISIVQDLSEKLKAFIEKDDFDGTSKTLIDHVKVDFLTSVYKTCKKKTSEFYVWILPFVDKFIMNSKSNLRRLSIELLSYIMSEVPSVMNAQAIEENKGIFRQILLNLMEVLKLNLSICEEDLFEKVSLALIYFSKTTDPMLIIGKLIGVARFEIEHISFSYKRREILFTVVGVLSSKFTLSDNMLRSVLKMGRALIEHEETCEMVEELYNKLEASTKDPEHLTLIRNTRNRVDIMEGKLKRKTPSVNTSKAKKKKTT